MAVKAGVPVVPIVIRGSHHVLDNIRKYCRPGRIEVELLDPISTEGYSEENLDELVENVRNIMLDAYGDGSPRGTGVEIFMSPYGNG
ncbi:MAG: hypothetical protein M5R36_02170 [Deltaproteobacteria bacterium]|nr:hypothetical protein [Deltaproteobacteria bacterium]